MGLFSRSAKNKQPTQADFQAALAWEQNRLDGCIRGVVPRDLQEGLRAFLVAPNVRATLAVVKRHPDLAGRRGLAALEMLRATAAITGLKLHATELEIRLAFLRGLHDTGTTADDLVIPDDGSD
jgi:hypothetical protein